MTIAENLLIGSFTALLPFGIIAGILISWRCSKRQRLMLLIGSAVLYLLCELFYTLTAPLHSMILSLGAFNVGVPAVGVFLGMLIQLLLSPLVKWLRKQK